MPARFCAQCGAELTTRFEAGRERPVCPQCGFIVYRNPVPVGVVMATRDDQLLLVHRRHAPLADYWAPPAGYIEIDESIQEGAVREAKEETGLDIALDKLIEIYSHAKAGVVLLAFVGQVTGGSLSAAEDEVKEIGFFARNELPRQPPPVNGTAVEELFYRALQELLDAFDSRQI